MGKHMIEGIVFYKHTYISSLNIYYIGPDSSVKLKMHLKKKKKKKKKPFLSSQCLSTGFYLS